jgi:hypothetical protein
MGERLRFVARLLEGEKWATSQAAGQAPAQYCAACSKLRRRGAPLWLLPIDPLFVEPIRAQTFAAVFINWPIARATIR